MFDSVQSYGGIQFKQYTVVGCDMQVSRVVTR